MHYYLKKGSQESLINGCYNFSLKFKYTYLRNNFYKSNMFIKFKVQLNLWKLFNTENSDSFSTFNTLNFIENLKIYYKKKKHVVVKMVI